MPLVRDPEIQSRITQHDAHGHGRFPELLFRDGATEAFFEPEEVAVDAVVHGAEGEDGWLVILVSGGRMRAREDSTGREEGLG